MGPACPLVTITPKMSSILISAFIATPDACHRLGILHYYYRKHHQKKIKTIAKVIGFIFKILAKIEGLQIGFW
jgi:hypothetical protein